MFEQLQLWTDGGARGNPGPAASGVVIKNETEVVWEQGIYLGEMSNNQAEYLALLAGLDKAKELQAHSIVVHMDSQLVVEQVNRRYKVKDEGMKQRWGEVQALLENFAEWSVSYVPRAMNKRADQLVNQALDEH
jgi:ribonuclease HI